AALAAEAGGGRPGAALGGGAARAVRAAGEEAGGVPAGVPLPAGPDGLPALRGLPALGGAAGEWGDGGGLQDGVRAAAEAERDELGEGGGTNHPGPAGGGGERRLGRGLCPGAGGIRTGPSEGAAGSTRKEGGKSRITGAVEGLHPLDERRDRPPGFPAHPPEGQGGIKALGWGRALQPSDQSREGDFRSAVHDHLLSAVEI